MTPESAQRLLDKHGSHLFGWQRPMFLTLVEPVEFEQVVGRGRRAGWTVLLRSVEAALKDRHGDILWDGSKGVSDV